MKKRIVLALFALFLICLLFQFGGNISNTAKTQIISNNTEETNTDETSETVNQPDDSTNQPDDSPVTNTSPIPDDSPVTKSYNYKIIDQEDPKLNLDPGEKETLTVTLENTGKLEWNLDEDNGNALILGTYYPENRKSYFLDSTKIFIKDKDNKTTIESGETLTFDLTFTAPEEEGYYHEDFLPLISNEKWIKAETLSWDITVGNSFSDNYNYELITKTPETILPPYSTETAYFEAKNTGEIPWYRDGIYPVKFTSESVEAELMSQQVNPGETGRFSFKADSYIQNYNITFNFALGDIFVLEQTPLIWGVKTGGKLVALTFDDGYGNIDAFIDALNKEGVKGTFFILGVVAQNNPSAVKRIIDEGHLLANHSYNHPDFRTLSSDSVRWQLDHAREILRDITGYDVYPYARYPYGAHNKSTDAVLNENGWKNFYWTNGTGDFNYHANSAAGRRHIYYYATLNPPDRAIVLMHIISQSTLAVLPDIISYYRDNGYAFVTVDQL